MPAPVVEEGKQALKGFVGNVDVGIASFQFVLVEHTAVQIWDAPIFLLKVAFMAR